jgi:APA family basic amino acid/polyamine antiporter
VFCLALMSFLSAITWMAFGIWLVLGLIVYFGYARSRSALNHVTPTGAARSDATRP